MRISEHLLTTGGALKRWFLAQTLDAIAVGAIWFFGLLIIGVPWAVLWAILAAVLQFVPQVGLVLSLIGPAIAAAASGGLERMIYVLILYAIIAIVDGMALQPFLMKRTARVPIWASILAPVVLGILFNVWGVLLSAPLLAIIYAYRARAAARNASQGS
jgi:predicted PurR-regulated permease PerM